MTLTTSTDELEQAVLCCLLWGGWSDLLEADDFPTPVARTAFEAIKATRGTVPPIELAKASAMTVQTFTELSRTQRHKAAVFIASCFQLQYVGPSARYYAIRLIEAAYRRRIHQAATAWTQASEDAPADLLDQALDAEVFSVSVLRERLAKVRGEAA